MGGRRALAETARYANVKRWQSERVTLPYDPSRIAWIPRAWSARQWVKYSTNRVYEILHRDILAHGNWRLIRMMALDWQRLESGVSTTGMTTSAEEGGSASTQSTSRRRT